VHTVSDGAGGAFFAWLDARFNGNRVYMQRLDASGTAQWAANGIPVSPANQPVHALDLVPDASGGVVVVWNDPRTGAARPHAAGRRLGRSVDRGWRFDRHRNARRSSRGRNGAGGVLWSRGKICGPVGDIRLYAQRVSAAGVASGPRTAYAHRGGAPAV
jgi:hypothetical protein